MKNFNDIRRLTQSIEVKKKILEKYFKHLDQDEVSYINNSINLRKKFDEEVLDKDPNLEKYYDLFNEINIILNSYINKLKENGLYLKEIIKEEIRKVLKLNG